MQQLNLFESQLPLFPGMHEVQNMARCLGVASGRKPVKDLTMDVLKALKPKIEYFKRRCQESGLDEYIPLDWCLFWDRYSPESGWTREDRLKPWMTHF